MTPDEKKRILALAEQVAGIDPNLGYWLAHHAEATRNEGRATLTPICFHLLERVGQTPPDECVCGGGTIMGSPWADAEPPARPKAEPKAEPKAGAAQPAITFADEPQRLRVYRLAPDKRVNRPTPTFSIMGPGGRPLRGAKGRRRSWSSRDAAERALYLETLKARSR